MTAAEARRILAGMDRRALRLACGISQVTVARAFGVTRTDVCAWESRYRGPRDAVLLLSYLRFCQGLARHLEIRES